MADTVSPTASPRRGRPAVIDRERILATARTLDLDRLTMTALARRLGVTPAAIYHYFPSGDAVLDALAGDLLASVAPPPDDQPWADYLAAAAHALRDTMRASPWARGLVGRAHPTAAGLRLTDHAMRVLTGAGFAPRAALRATQLVLRFVVMDVTHEATRPDDEQSLGSLLDLMEHEPESVATIARLAPEIAPSDPDADFESQLQAVLRGIAATYGPDCESESR